MLDSNLKIDDEILQELLSQETDEKMRTIVTSIQREQNRVIRDDQHQVLLVQGPAGSGKTSIALHVPLITYTKNGIHSPVKIS